MERGFKQICFVDMPFRKKTDPATGVEIDFDEIYAKGIKPAVEAAGLDCIRGDEERTGGIIHEVMFARLLLSDFVIADLTSANANVFYELGIRHAARPYSTIPIFAMIGHPPFDVNFIRAIPYELADGHLTDAAAVALQQGLVERIRAGLTPPVHEDSPLFRFFPTLKGIDMTHEITDVFRERVAYAQAFKDKLAEAREIRPRDAAIAQLNAIRHELGDLQVVEQGVLVDFLLSYRDVSAFQEMIELYEAMPGSVQDAAVVRQQYALALNRIGERRKAMRILEPILKNGGDAETYGILGRVYKDYYKAAQAQGRAEARAYLEKAIETYTKGFEVEPIDYYPGINAILLLVDLGTDDAIKQIDRLVPLVSFAVARRGGASSSDYWDLATTLTLALLGNDPVTTEAVLPRVLAAAEAGWMVETTADDLERIAQVWAGKRDTGKLQTVAASLRGKEAYLKGLPAAAG